jgi:hypothetical protein
VKLPAVFRPTDLQRDRSAVVDRERSTAFPDEARDNGAAGSDCRGLADRFVSGDTVRVEREAGKRGQTRANHSTMTNGESCGLSY